VGERRFAQLFQEQPGPDSDSTASVGVCTCSFLLLVKDLKESRPESEKLLKVLTITNRPFLSSWEYTGTEID
jgi:hypothetical protein